jgi:hypothetical protein
VIANGARLWYVTRKQFARVRGNCVASTHCFTERKRRDARPESQHRPRIVICLETHAELAVCGDEALRVSRVKPEVVARGSAVEFPNDVSARSVLVPSRKIGPSRIAEALAAIVLPSLCLRS